MIEKTFKKSRMNGIKFSARGDSYNNIIIITMNKFRPFESTYLLICNICNKYRPKVVYKSVQK